MTESSKVDHKIFLIMGNSHSGQKVSGNSFSLTATEAELFDFSDCKYSKSLNIVILTGFFSVNEDSEDDDGYGHCDMDNDYDDGDDYDWVTIIVLRSRWVIMIT